jgi:hypothetical protein
MQLGDKESFIGKTNPKSAVLPMKEQAEFHFKEVAMEKLVDEQKEENVLLTGIKLVDVETDDSKATLNGGNASFFPDDFKLIMEALD